MIVGLYVRVSTMEQATEGYSIAEQTDRLTQYAQSFGWNVYKVYTDAGYSGSSTDRPAMQALIGDCKAHKLDKVIVYKLDRLSRSQLDTLYLIENVFLANGIDFSSMTENFDTATPFGKAMIGILAVFAQLEREQIKERMITGKIGKVKQGKYLKARMTPIGYDYIDDQLVINPFEALQVQEIFDRFIGGESINQIAASLNAKGFVNKYGTWKTITIRRLMGRKLYAGYVSLGGRTFKGNHDAIVSEETWEKAQQRLTANKERWHDHTRDGVATSYLGGMLYCARCGRKYHKRQSSHNAYYVCDTITKNHPVTGTCDNKRWRMEMLDNIVFEQIKTLKIRQKKEELPVNDKLSIDEDSALKTQLETMQKQIDRLLDLYSIGNIPKDELQKKIDEINDRKAALETALNNEKQTFADVEPLILSFDDVLEKGTLSEIRTVLHELIDRIEIDGDDLTIVWNFM